MKYYTGVGSRETPENICKLIERIAFKLADLGWHLRSGGAQGADAAFEKGVIEHGMPWADLTQYMSIYIPWELYHPTGVCNKIVGSIESDAIAASVHPAWGRCSRGAKALHSRNVYQVLGDDLQTPSSFLICWAEPTKTGVKGGTNTAWQLAKKQGIKCFNLYLEEDRQRIEKWLR